MQLKFNSFHLKLFAVIFMIIDHIAYYCISPDLSIYIIMRIIGRLAAPIFWFCFVEGYKRTRNKKKYKIRLLIAAIIMSVGNVVIHYVCDTEKLSLFKPNMFLSFLMCAITIDIINKCIKSKSIIKTIVFFVLSIIIVFFIGTYCEYSYFIISFILLYHFVQNDVIKNQLYILLMVVLSILLKAPLQIFAIGSVLFFAIYNNTKPKHNWKCFFYLFYPLHIWFLIIISKLL